MLSLFSYYKGPRASKSGDSGGDLETKINNAVFPGLQGGPHNNAIAAIATAMLQTKSEQFKEYQEQVIKNARALAKELENLGLKIVTGGTDIHLFLVDVRQINITGSKAEYILEQIAIACNKNTGINYRSLCVCVLLICVVLYIIL